MSRSSSRANRPRTATTMPSIPSSAGPENEEEPHNHQQRRQIHFLHSLSSIPLPYELLTGVRILTVEKSGKTKAAILNCSVDRFTIFIRDDHPSSQHQQKQHLQHQQQQRSSSASTTGSSGSSVNGSGGGGLMGDTNKTTKSVFGLFREAYQHAVLGVAGGGSGAERALDIGEVERIQRGQSTQQFEFAKKHVINGNHHPPLPPQQHKLISDRGDLLRREMSTSSVSSARSGTSAATTTTIPISQLDPSLSFSIIFRGAHTVDLMAKSESARTQICDALDAILEAYQRRKTRVSTDILLLRYIWLGVDKAKTGYINANQCYQVLQAINFNMPHKDVVTAYEKLGKIFELKRTQRKTGLTFEQSATFLHKIKRDSWMVKPVNVFWNELFGEFMNNQKRRATVSEKTFLEKFLVDKQRQASATLVQVRKLFRRLHDMEFAHTVTTHVDLSRINKDQFEEYLLSSENDAFDPDRARFHEPDMDRPLSEYFINSSHNTYLIGDQYASHSSVEMYSNALYRGARCLELDIWDGPKCSRTGAPIPVVWHGGFLTTKVRFTDIIKTIKVFLNFHPDTYPIILSFENHCSIPYQKFMAKKLLSILGDSLYVPTESSLFGELPSPLKLKGMVVIKGRRPDGTEADQYDTDDDSDTDEGTGSSYGDVHLAELSPTDALRVRESMVARQQVVKHGVAPELASLTLFHGHKWKSFEASANTRKFFMHSFSENKVKSRCRQKLTRTWIAYNQTHMSRTYPGGSRLDSSNFNPLLSWSAGCQMVALNFQTEDAFLRLNDGRFRENGNCGYVLKPSALMSRVGVESSKAVQLSIKVLSGSCLPKAKGLRTGDCIDPYVKVAVYDVKNAEKETMTQFSTQPVPSNGYFPIWNHEPFRFSVENWAVAMLQVTVYDKVKEEFIASSSIPIPCLRQGIRCVRLYDSTNTRSGAFDFASLLLDIEVGKSVGEI